MATDTNTATRWHTVVPTALGRLSLVRDVDALLGLYYPHHWYMPNPATFGPRCDEGFEEAIRQLNEYFAGQRRLFGLPLAPRGDEFQHSVWNLEPRPAGSLWPHDDLRGPGRAPRRRRDRAAGRRGHGSKSAVHFHPLPPGCRPHRQADRLRRRRRAQAAPARSGAVQFGTHVE